MKKLLFILCLFSSSLFAQGFTRTIEGQHGFGEHAAVGFISGVVAGGVVFWKTHNSGLTLTYTFGVPVILGAGKETCDKYFHTGVASWDDFAYTVYGGMGAVVGLGGYLAIHNQTKQERELKRIQGFEMNKGLYDPDVWYEPVREKYGNRNTISIEHC